MLMNNSVATVKVVNAADSQSHCLEGGASVAESENLATGPVNSEEEQNDRILQKGCILEDSRFVLNPASLTLGTDGRVEETADTGDKVEPQAEEKTSKKKKDVQKTQVPSTRVLKSKKAVSEASTSDLVSVKRRNKKMEKGNDSGKEKTLLTVEGYGRRQIVIPLEK
nr:PREDICTED: uncharacterized protein LOC106706720 [Latimeria chalumnae]|eukprot:XP_014353538.1 PREDICTED: uncharacterized protein LOC106706720 [Latimeria chalumnae]